MISLVIGMRQSVLVVKNINNMIEHFESPEYEFLSNFALVDIEYKGAIFPSVEHAYQSAKCDDPKWKLQCQDREIKPGKIKSMAKLVKSVDGWPQFRLVVMRELIKKKFEQEPFRQKLIDTGHVHIQEGNHWYDSFWGVRTDNGKGQNHLGRIIMDVRDELLFRVEW